MEYVNWSALAAIVSVSVVVAALAAGIRWSVVGPASAVRTAATILLLGAVAAITALSLLGRSFSITGMNLVPFRSIVGELGNVSRELAVLNIAGNVVMYTPIGFLVPLAFDVRWFNGVSAGVVLSVVMEFLQRVFDSGATDVDDVILNGTGALMGAALAALATWSFRKREPVAAPERR